MKPSTTHSTAQRRNAGLGGYTGPRERKAGEAMPYSLPFEGTYKRPDMEPTRPTANDHLSIKSRGF